MIVNHTLELGLKIRYSDPSMVGADRLCSAVAAYQKYNQSVIVVDFGTATTFDVVNNNAEYLGGVISPGIETTASALYQRAAKLPKISLHFLPPIQPSEIKSETKKEHYLLVSEKIMCDIIKICNLHNGRA